MTQGKALVMRFWNERYARILWGYPINASPTGSDVGRGTCETNYGRPTTIESRNASAITPYSLL